MNFTNASSVFPILCRNQGCKGCMCPQVFGRSVDPISTRRANYAQHITTCPLGFSDLLTALSCIGSSWLYARFVRTLTSVATSHSQTALWPIWLLVVRQIYKTEIWTCKHLLKMGSHKIIYWLEFSRYILFHFGFYYVKQTKRFVILYSNLKFSMQPLMLFFDIIKTQKERVPTKSINYRFTKLSY